MPENDSPYNDQQTPNSTKKKGGCLKWGGIIIGILIIIGIISAIANGGDSDDDKGTDSSSNSSTDGQKDGEKDNDEPLAVGDTYTTKKDVDVTVNAIHPASDPLGGEYFAAEVTYLNNGDDEIDFGDMDWNVQTPDGVVSNATIAGLDDNLTTGKLAPGGTVSGTVYFDGGQPGEYSVTWKPSFSFSSDEATWVGAV